jgi:hypothetical protein
MSPGRDERNLQTFLAFFRPETGLGSIPILRKPSVKTLGYCHHDKIDVDSARPRGDASVQNPEALDLELD